MNYVKAFNIFELKRMRPKIAISELETALELFLQSRMGEEFDTAYLMRMITREGVQPRNHVQWLYNKMADISKRRPDLSYRGEPETKIIWGKERTQRKIIWTFNPLETKSK